MVVRAGAPKPDIGSVDALKRTLLDAKSIAYSASASGVYLSTEVFPRLGIADQIKDKSQDGSRASGWPPWWRAARPRSASSRSASCCPCRASSLSGRCRRRSRR